MQKTTITFLPTAVPDSGFLARGDADKTFPIATDNGQTMVFARKLTLTSGAAGLQIMTPDGSGLFTQADPVNSFSIDGEFAGIQMLSPTGTPSSYSARIFINDTTRNAVVPGTTSQVVIPNAANNNPQVAFVEMSHDTNGSIVREVGFIGTMDVRPGLATRVIIRPGETVYVKRDANGSLVFQY